MKREDKILKEKGKENLSFPCIILEKRENILIKESRELLKEELAEFLISCRGLKKEKLRKIWEDYELGFLKKSVEEIRKEVKEKELNLKDIFDNSFPKTSSFDLKELVIPGKSYKIIKIKRNNEYSVWKEKTPSVIIQFPFFLEKGFQKEEVFVHTPCYFRPYKEDTEIQGSILAKGVVKEIDSKYIFSLEDPSFSLEKWFFESGNDIQIEKAEEEIDFKEEDLVLKTLKSYYISKVDTEKRFVYGPVLIPDEVDAQRDIVSAEEIQKAAWDFMEDSGTTSFMHTTGLTVEGIRHQVERAVQEGYTLHELINGVSGDPLVSGIKNVLEKPITFSDKIKIRESYLAPVDFQLGNRKIKEGTWVMGMHIISDILWEEVKSGYITGFSIEGRSQRIAE